jgi:hypothetical protein
MKWIPFAAAACTVTLWGQDQPKDLPNLAAGVLEQTALAQEAISAHDKIAALDHIKMAQMIAADIQKRGGPAPVLVPVRTEVETTSTYTPVKHKDGEMTASRLKKNTSIREVDAEITTSNLNVTVAADRLADAQTAMEHDDFATAGKALSGVTASIVTTRSEGGMPLLMARQNLELARARILDGKYHDAAVPLRSAAEALDQYARQFPGPNAEKAEDMRVQIDAYAAEITHHHEDALMRIESWLDPVDHWYNGTIPK